MNKVTNRTKAQGSVIGLILLVGITATACTSTTSTHKTTSSSTHTQVSAAPTTAQQPTPNYTIVGKTTKGRKDNSPSYYVVIDPPDLSNDAFTYNVKLVLQAIAKTNGSPNFSASIFDNEEIARTEYSNNTTYPDRTPDEIKAEQAAKETHLIAMYSGGWDINSAQPSTADDAYTISWFPATFTDNPTVGKYVGNGQWKP